MTAIGYALMLWGFFGFLGFMAWLRRTDHSKVLIATIDALRDELTEVAEQAGASTGAEDRSRVEALESRVGRIEAFAGIGQVQN